MDVRPVLFFDIDNCLYPRSKKVHDLMHVLINNFFEKHLSLSTADAIVLHQRYYKDYGLAISGLVQHHKVDAMEFNREVDDALPLDGLITPNEELRKLLCDIDTTKVKLWLFTNAHITHGQRVVRLLGVDDLFEGITFCDYRKLPFVCKPHTEMFEKAEEEAVAPSTEDCYFVDDSELNCRHAHARGWNTAHLLEAGIPDPTEKAARYQIRDLEELRDIFPQFFKDQSMNKL
ncbi:MAG: hypothetical protein LQ351_007052 [Letrouitia transgressa]|nr:MAG: hypothetical protein LQ351_007052 [Letrouitia transgressa]